MWRRSGDGEVYAYMPNEQVIWIVIQIIDNKAFKLCDFDQNDGSNNENKIIGIGDEQMWR